MNDPKEIQNLIEKYWETIPPVWHVTRHTIRQVAIEKYQITVEQFQVLRRIRKGVDEVSRLADASLTSKSAVSKVVDALVNKGLVNRLTDTRDRRHVHLALTDEGIRLMSGIYTDTENWLAEKLKLLSATELDITMSAMDILRKVFIEK